MAKDRAAAAASASLRSMALEGLSDAWVEQARKGTTAEPTAARETATLTFAGRRYEVSIEMVTPEKAAAYLERNGRNRKIIKNAVSGYAVALQRDEWRLNGETLIFNEDGHLVQGQHRCSAVVLSGCSMPVFVVRGVSRDAFKTMDGGRKRTTGDVLGIQGETNSVILATAARAIVRMTEGGVARDQASSSYLLSVVEQHPTIREWASAYAKCSARTFLPSGVIGILTLAGESHGEPRVAKFLTQVATGVGLQRDMPSYLLREKLNNRARGQHFSSDMAMAYCIKALNAFLQGRPMKLLRLSPDEPFPSLI